MAMQKRLYVRLSAEERKRLTDMVENESTPARVMIRARVLLLADKGAHRGAYRTYDAIHEKLGVCVTTVCRICRQFVEHGMDAALYDKRRSVPARGPVKITSEIHAHLLELAASPPPEGKKRWTYQMLADQLVEAKLVDSITTQSIYNHLRKGKRNAPVVK